MSNVKQVTIDPNIKLDENRIKGMPDDIKGRLLVTMTIAMERYECDWTDLRWAVKPDGIISVKRKQWALQKNKKNLFARLVSCLKKLFQKRICSSVST